MKAYKTRVHITTAYDVEVHGEDETEATQTAENMDNTQIEAAGDFVESVKVEVTDIEVMYPDDEEDDEEPTGVPDVPQIVADSLPPLPELEPGFVDLDSLKAPEETEESEGEVEPNE